MKKKPWWRWLLLPLSPIAVPIAFIHGVRKGIKKNTKPAEGPIKGVYHEPRNPKYYH